MFAGIDTHKDTLAVAVIDEQGRLVDQAQVPNSEQGFVKLTDLLIGHHVRRVGIEGSGSYGRAVAIHLALAWPPALDPAHLTGDRPELEVVEVPTLMTSRERRAQLRGKTDPVDALAVARVTAREPNLPPVRLATGPASDLRALLDYREDLLHERTALVNRVHADLIGLRPGYQHQIRSLTTRTRVRKALDIVDDLDNDANGARALITRRRLMRVLAIDAEAAELKQQITRLVEQTGTSLTTIHGIGPVVAGRLLAEVVDVRRYPHRNTFAAANGTAPIPASSGRTVRHRYNPGGNRQLNKALYIVAITQIRGDTEGRRYYDRKRAEGKTGREALRCLKRRLSDLVYRTMTEDIATQPATTPTDPVTPDTVTQGTEGAVGAPDANEARLTA